MSVLFYSWLWGLSAFLSLMPMQHETAQHLEYDAIVVYTGGQGRINAALELFANNDIDYLFISGTGNRTTIDHILSMSDEDIKIDAGKIECCINLDKISKNTHENALNAAKWIKNNDLNSIILVTADYHMPRSLFETRSALSDIEITPYALRRIFESDDQAKIFFLVISEYHKYSYVFLKNKIMSAAAMGSNLKMPKIKLPQFFK